MKLKAPTIKQKNAESKTREVFREAMSTAIEEAFYDEWEEIIRQLANESTADLEVNLSRRTAFVSICGPGGVLFVDAQLDKLTQDFITNHRSPSDKEEREVFILWSKDLARDFEKQAAVLRCHAEKLKGK